jgi:hypothetical protein
MKIRIYDKEHKKEYFLSNQNLKVGDKVFPLLAGYTKGGTYYVSDIRTEDFMTGFPNDPHTIKDLHHSDYKPYQIRTDKGYGVAEIYFKLVADREKSDTPLSDIFESYHHIDNMTVTELIDAYGLSRCTFIL